MANSWIIFITIFLATVYVKPAEPFLKTQKSYGSLLDQFLEKLEALPPLEKQAITLFKNHLYDSKVEKNQNTSILVNLKCLGCSLFAKAVNELPKQSLNNILIEVITKACELKLATIVCSRVVKEMGEIVFSSLEQRYLSQDFLCGDILEVCSPSYSYLSAQEFINSVIKDKPEKTLPKPSKKKSYRVLHLSDVHLDVDYLVGGSADCKEPLCCRPESTPRSEAKAPFWGYLGNCDLPQRTIEAFAHFVKNHIDNIKFMIWTGDNVAHDSWNQSETKTLQSINIVTQILKENLPNIPFFPSMGNHEPFPDNMFDFKNGQSKWLTEGLAKVWGDILGEEATKAFNTSGYYSKEIQSLNLRIISLFTQACSRRNYFSITDPTDPGKMLEWLENELAIAERNNQSVFLIGHIPSQSECLSEWSARYRALIDRYSFIIRGQFFGHVHSENFWYSQGYKNSSEIVGVVLTPGSLTTCINNFPSFRIYEIDEETNMPIDYLQYRMNLTKYNELNDTEEVIFENVYNFTTEYGQEDLSLESFINIGKLLRNDLDFIKKYTFNHYQGSPSAKNSSDSSSLDTGKGYFCASLDYNVSDPDCPARKMDLESKIENALTGRWRKVLS